MTLLVCSVRPHGHRAGRTVECPDVGVLPTNLVPLLSPTQPMGLLPSRVWTDLGFILGSSNFKSPSMGFQLLPTPLTQPSLPEKHPRSTRKTATCHEPTRPNRIRLSSNHACIHMSSKNLKSSCKTTNYPVQEIFIKR